MIKQRIMYVCSECAEGCPEACGHYDRTELRVMPDGAWLCESCFDNNDDNEFLSWGHLPAPEEYGRIPASAQDAPQPIAWRWKVSPMQLNWQYSDAPPATFPVYNLELLYTDPPRVSEDCRRCQKCGMPTKGEEAYVNGEYWCHPCADACPLTEGEPPSLKRRSEADAYYKILQTIARFPITDPKNQDAVNLQLIAKGALELSSTQSLRQEG